MFLTAKPVESSFNSRGQTLREEYDCEETVTKSVYGSIKDYCSFANEDETGDEEEVGNDGDSTAECLLLSIHTDYRATGNMYGGVTLRQVERGTCRLRSLGLRWLQSSRKKRGEKEEEKTPQEGLN